MPTEMPSPLDFAVTRRTELHAAGYVEIRPFLAAADARRFRELVSQIYALMEQRAASSRNTGLRDAFVSWRGVWQAALPEFLEKEAGPQLAFVYGEMIDHVSSRARALLGDTWRYEPRFSFFRRQFGPVGRLPWHIDADAGNLGIDPAINVWVPFDDVGVDLPSLAVVPRSNTAMRGLPLLRPEVAARNDEFVAAIGTACVPVLRLGDAIAFDSFTLHRTQPLAISETAVRTAAEFRFVVA